MLDKIQNNENDRKIWRKTKKWIKRKWVCALHIIVLLQFRHFVNSGVRCRVKSIFSAWCRQTASTSQAYKWRSSKEQRGKEWYAHGILKESWRERNFVIVLSCKDGTRGWETVPEVKTELWSGLFSFAIKNGRRWKCVSCGQFVHRSCYTNRGFG